MRKIMVLIIILLFPSRISAKTFELNVTCIDENENVLKSYNLYGEQYEKIKLSAPKIKNHMIVGADYKFITFDINYDVKFIYTKADAEHNYQLHKKYINGFDGKYFLPDKEITWSEAIVMLYNIHEIYKEEIQGSDDLIWHEKATDYFFSIGFGEFFDEHDFEQDKLMTRYEFISLVSLYIDSCISDNVMNTFLQTNNMGRWQNITRAEAVCIINMFLGRDNMIENSENYILNFLDVPENHRFYHSILEAGTTHKCINKNNNEKWIKE